MRPVLYTMATNGLTRKFEEYKNYGGLLVENLCQSVARDLIADAMVKAEKAGFEVLLSVHDELIAERKIGESTLKDFEDIMLNTPAWAEGLPIAVEGFKSQRYRK
jgi:DNA polymerase